MKKLVLAILLAMVAFAPLSALAWSKSFGPMTPDEMKLVTCRNGGFTNLGIEVIGYHDPWSGYQVEVRPAQVDLFPEPAQVRQFRVGVGTELSEVFPVGSTVTYVPYPEYSVETGGPMVMVSPAGTSTFGGSTIVRHGGGMYLQVR